MRVIAGEYGGRRLEAPSGLKTRPTSDRVREALFMSFGDLTGLRVVDLYAGSGAQGIEALSRGADFVDFVDSLGPACAVIRRNLEALGISKRARVWSLGLPHGLRQMHAVLARADLVLVDPPYGGHDARAVLEALGAAELRPGVRVALERHQKDEVQDTAGSLALVRERRYGETVVNLYQAGPMAAPEGGTPS